MKAYHAYKMQVQAVAGDIFHLPMNASCDNPVLVKTHAHFYHGVHPDPENVHKGIVDALFWSRDKRGSDKHVGGTFTYPVYDRENPRVEVEVLWLAMQ